MLDILLFTGWGLKHVDEKGQRMGRQGAFPHIPKLIMCFCHFSFAVDRKTKYGNSAGKVTLKLLQTQLKLWSARCLTSKSRFFMKFHISFYTKEVQISLHLCLNLQTFWSLPSLPFFSHTAVFSHSDLAVTELPSPDNHEENDRKEDLKIEAKVVFSEIIDWHMENYGQRSREILTQDKYDFEHMSVNLTQTFACVILYLCSRWPVVLIYLIWGDRRKTYMQKDAGLAVRRQLSVSGPVACCPGQVTSTLTVLTLHRGVRRSISFLGHGADSLIFHWRWSSSELLACVTNMKVG